MFSKDVALFKARLSHDLPISTIAVDPAAMKYKEGDIVKTTLGQDLKILSVTPLKSIHEYEHRNDLTDEHISYYDRYANSLTALMLAPITVAQRDTKDVFKFGESFTSVSGSYVQQIVVPNVRIGDTVREGDVIAYNSGFFEPVFGTKQVSWKHGIMATVAFMETDATLEDANAISEEFSQRLEMTPAHKRTIRLTTQSTIHKFVSVGDHVQTTDVLCVIEDEGVSLLSLTTDPDALEILEDMTRKSLKAKYSGTIAKIDVQYAADPKTMSPSVQALVTRIVKDKNRIAAKMAGTSNELYYPKAEPLPVGTHLESTELTKDDVLIYVYIKETINQSVGDKIVFVNNLKSITSYVLPKPIYTESGIVIDAQMGGRSAQNRIVTSPILYGGPNRVLEKLEYDVFDILGI